MAKILLWVLILIRILIAAGIIYFIVLELKRLKNEEKEDE